MILLIGRIRIASENVETFRQHLKPFLAVSRAETGCIRFTVSEDVEQANYFLFTEIWEDEARLHQHESSAHLTHFKQSIGEWIVERELTQVYSITSARDL